MRVLLVLLGAAIALAAMACGPSGPPPTPTPAPTPTPELPAGTPFVDSPVEKFKVKTHEIKVGTWVIWTNLDATRHRIAHTPLQTGEAKLWDSGNLDKDRVYRFRFDTPGEYAYRCTIHPVVMRGTITVAP